MCSYIELAAHRNARIKWCKDCGCNLIQMQNISISLNPEGFASFRKDLVRCLDKSIRDRRPPDAREIIIRTILPGLDLIFNRKEISLLLRLMDVAENRFIDLQIEKVLA